jgi:Putative transposase, YhgA-like
MKLRELTEEEYLVLKEKLHHAHDKVWKITLHDKEAIQEYLSKVIAPLLIGVELVLDNLKLDNTTYVRSNLQAFYSDVVYWAELIDLETQERIPVTTAFLMEHKSRMPTELQMRLQLADYAVSIMNQNYDEKTDTTIGVIPIVFNQFGKTRVPQTFRSLFKNLPANITRFFIDFDYLMTDLPDFSDEMIGAFDKYGTLRATFLAMKYVRNKTFLIDHFEEIFLFLEKHPQKLDLRDQLIAYLLGNSDITARDLENMLKNIFSPIIQKEVMMTGTGMLATAAREAEIRTRKEEKLLAQTALQAAVQAAAQAAAQVQTLKARIVAMRCWDKKLAPDAIADIAELPQKEVDTLIVAFEKVSAYLDTQKRVNINELMRLSGLQEVEVKALVDVLKPAK